MNPTLKTLLTIAAVAVALYLIYQFLNPDETAAINNSSNSSGGAALGNPLPGQGY